MNRVRSVELVISAYKSTFQNKKLCHKWKTFRIHYVYVCKSAVIEIL